MELKSSSQSPSLKENLVNTSKRLHENRKLNFSLSALFYMKTRVSLKYFVRGCSAFDLYTFKTTFREKSHCDVLLLIWNKMIRTYRKFVK